MFMIKKSSILMALTISLILYAYSHASVAEFTATEACEATPSIHKQGNPGDIKLVVGESYPLLQGNKPDNPEWYLLRIESANPTNRWVKVDCGNVNNSDAEKKPEGNEACGLSNQADSYVFAVSWQPAFCESKPDKAECATHDPTVYQASHFTLHGLWPNKVSCGIGYGYCGEVKDKPANFCDYPQVNLSATVRNQLSVVMPSVSAGSCLERHEWYKHGACQTAAPDQYFEKATNLVHQFNDSGISEFMKNHINRQVSLEEFRVVLDSSLGIGGSSHAKLGCKQGLLVDIYINLPADIKTDANLKELVSKAPQAPADKSCQNGFRIDPIGQGLFN